MGGVLFCFDQLRKNGVHLAGQQQAECTGWGARCCRTMVCPQYLGMWQCCTIANVAVCVNDAIDNIGVE